MWLRLATSENKEELLEIASELRSLGAKVEIREIVEFEEEEQFILRGKLSELRKNPAGEKYAKELERWERWIQILRGILKDERISYNEFMDKFLSKEAPKSYETAKKFIEGGLSAEELISSAENAIRIRVILDELTFFLLRNGIEIGEFIRGNLPEDPEVIITVDEASDGSKKLTTIHFFPVWELYVDVISLLGEEVENKELGSLLGVISNIILNIEKTEDLEKLRELSSGLIEEENEEILINCEEIFDLIVRSLEKAGIVRVSGKKIKMRKRQW
ncbi:MAG: hypothetical protein QXY19_04420 [Archaeoglobaceae archaeon]